MKKSLFLTVLLAVLSTSCGGGGDNPGTFGGWSKVEYGLYPQTVVTDSDLINRLNLEATNDPTTGWSILENNYYAKLEATPQFYNEGGVFFENGDEVINGQSYWFYVEPVSWLVIGEKTQGEYYLLTEKVLDIHQYDSRYGEWKNNGVTVYPDNYSLSAIRSWLTGEFYNQVFSGGDSHVLLREVDNSSATSGDSGARTSKIYAGNVNTTDKIFLPSFQEMQNTAYGFDEGVDECAKREAKTTDYYRAKGGWYSNSEEYKGNAQYYWTRSPESASDSAIAIGASSYAVLTYGSIWDPAVANKYGVRPAIIADFKSNN